VPPQPAAPQAPPLSAADRWGVALALYGSFMAGLGLRVWNLRGQVLGGDELHAVRAAVTRPLSEILTTYALNDYSIPLTALFRFLLEHGVRLSELGFRLPALLCGLLALILIPRSFLGKVDRGTVELLAFLIALSPGLVLYSRIARSYMPMVLASFLAVMAFEAWWRTRAWKPGAAYLVLGGLAVWLHLGAGPIVVSPFLFAAGDLLRDRRQFLRRALELIGMGLALAGTFALFLVPARESLLRLVASKHREPEVPFGTVGDVLRLQAGTPSITVAVLFWIAALAGLALLLRDRPRLAVLSVIAAVGQVVGIAILSPAAMGNPLVLNRYLMPALPWVLLWVAHALSLPFRLPLERGPGCAGRIAQRMGARFVVLLLFWTGPFLSPGFRTSSFMLHNDFVAFQEPRATLPDAAVPALYRRLPRGPVVEYPWPPVWRFNRSFYIYQRIHRQRVMVSAPFDLPRDPRLAFRNEVPPDSRALLASPARTLIVHLQPGWEEDRVSAPGRPPDRGLRPDLRRQYRRAGERLAERLTREWGPPDYADATVRSWDLERLRRAGLAEPPAGQGF
jgi:hypothetical protein